VTQSQQRGGSGWAEFSTYETESGAKFFVKTSRRDAEMFMGEGAGLRAMHATNTLVIPRVHHAGATPEGCREGNSFIVMDYLNFGARGDQAAFGRQLALMHAAEPAVEEAKVGGGRRDAGEGEEGRGDTHFHIARHLFYPSTQMDTFHSTVHPLHTRIQVTHSLKATWFQQSNL
jgi:hypothetical protein